MISYLNGILTEKEINYVVVDVSGVGYQVYIPVLDHSNLPQIKEQVKIYTYLYVKEDIMKLYGSLEKKALSVFEKLISVSGIGPKVGMGILSAMYFNDVVMAILEENATAFSKCPGIGNKTAQKIILELKDKFKNYQVSKEDANRVGKTCALDLNEAIEALQCLGYSKKVSEDIVKKVTKDKKDVELADIVKLALKELSR